MKAIMTKYLPATNTKGSRIKAHDSDNNSVTISYNGREKIEEAHIDAALTLCEKMKWYGELVPGHTKDGMVFVFDTDKHYCIKPEIKKPIDSLKEKENENPN